METKICKSCNQELDIESFYKRGDTRDNKCIVCVRKSKLNKKLGSITYKPDDCAHIFKIVSSRGILSQEEYDAYQIVKSDYSIQTGRNLPQVNERIKKCKN